MIAVMLFDLIHETFAARNVHAFVVRIEEEVIRITVVFDFRDRMPRGGIENQ